MKCPNCGETKDDYHFFKHRNKYDRFFFAAGIPHKDICWACGGPYKCVGCQQIKPHTEFRVGGGSVQTVEPLEFIDLRLRKTR